MAETVLSRRIFMNTLLGRCELIPHGMDEQPTGRVAMGYVELQGRAGNYKLGIFRDGEWLDHKARPFNKPVVGWASVLKDDGTPLF